MKAKPSALGSKVPWLRPLLVILFCCSVFCGAAAGQAPRAPFADAEAAPPSAAKAGPAALPPDLLAECLNARQLFHVFDEFEGAAQSLAELYPKKPGEPLRGGEVVELALSGADLLGAPVATVDGMSVYAASIVSVDARGVKPRLDVSGMQPGEEVWVVDARNLASFGPYAATAGGENELWTATILCDEAVLLVKTPYEDVPPLAVTAYSHVFRSIEDVAKELACNVNIACESDPATVAAASGVGIFSYIFDERQWFCSGTLINNASTPAPDFEPFFTTANHCICSQERVDTTEVIWDYRADACGVEGPDPDSLMLRSFGEKLLATSAALDATLMELDFVPVGPYGRIYLGWDSRLLTAGEPVKCIHHPDATHMRITKGTVRAINDDKNGRENQTLVHWDIGVTEAGSSGSCLLLDNEAENNRIVGMLSQGPDHSCSNTINNLDWFASFHEFFPMIQPYIESNSPSTEQGENDCGDVDDGCPLSLAYSGAPATLDGLRAVRDKALMPTGAGRRAVEAYYKAAPTIAPLVKRSPAARAAVIAATAPVAWIGPILELLTDYQAPPK